MQVSRAPDLCPCHKDLVTSLKPGHLGQPSGGFHSGPQDQEGTSAAGLVLSLAFNQITLC